MKVTIYPTKNKFSDIYLPCSKSLAHRAIICASLARGRSVINNVDLNEDIVATIEALKHFKASINYIDQERKLIIDGHGLEYDSGIINACESGSTLRFLIPLIALCDMEGTFIGSKRLMQRPQSVYEDIFAKQNISYYRDDKIVIKGKLTSGTYEVDGDISSQFISGLMFALPLLDGDSIIRIKPPYSSKSYVDLTIDVLKSFGITIQQCDEYTYHIGGQQQYIANDYNLEADYSQLVFFASLGLINNGIRCFNFYSDSLQGDKELIANIQRMNGQITRLENGFRFDYSNLEATTIDLQDTPDLGPMLFALATQAQGTTRFINVHRLRLKESDRILAMETELRKLGCNITSMDNEVIVTGKSDIVSNGLVLDSHNDHRVIMSLCILATIANDKLVIDNCMAINKSYPTFFDDLKKCGIRLELGE